MALKLGRFYEQPIVYIIIGLISTILILDNYYEKAGLVLLALLFSGATLFFANKIYKVKQIEVNPQKHNSGYSLLIAVIGIGVTIGISILIGGSLLGWNAGSIADFFTYNKASVIGAAVSPFANNPFVEFLIFVLAFPIAETILFIQLYDLICKIFGVQKLSFADPRALIAMVPMVVGVIYYHIFAKSIATGKPNENVLLIIGALFFTELLIVVFTATQGKPEMEPAIYHHMINNALALGITQYIVLFTNYLTIIVAAGLLLLYFSKTGNNLLRKWKFVS